MSNLQKLFILLLLTLAISIGSPAATTHFQLFAAPSLPSGEMKRNAVAIPSIAWGAGLISDYDSQLSIGLYYEYNIASVGDFTSTQVVSSGISGINLTDVHEWYARDPFVNHYAMMELRYYCHREGEKRVYLTGGTGVVIGTSPGWSHYRNNTFVEYTPTQYGSSYAITAGVGVEYRKLDFSIRWNDTQFKYEDTFGIQDVSFLQFRIAYTVHEL